MKKFNIILLLLFSMLLVSCNNGNENNTGDDVMVENFWNSKKVYNETVVLVDDGTDVWGKLLFAPTKVISVFDYTLKHEYSKDEYYIEGNKIFRSEESTIPFLTEDNLAGKNLPDGYGFTTYQAKEPGTEIIFTEGIGIVMHQIAVTYEHNDTWTGFKPLNQEEKFPNTLAKLKNKENLRVLINGDSISTGANSSGVLGIEPYQDDFANLFVNYLKNKYDTEIELINTSVGGMMSDWGKEHVDTNVNSFEPDLVIIGYGMNDGSLKMSPAKFIENIDFMVRSIKARNENAEIILIATMLANPISLQNSIQKEYLPGLNDLAEEYNIGLLNMSLITEYLYETKRGVDILANNINHPSDFLVRIYARGLIDTLIKE